MSELAGRYRLTSWRRADGSEPFGADPKGILVYGPDGRMSVMFSASGREQIGLPMEDLMEARQKLKKPWTLVGSGLLGALKRYVNGVTNFMAYAGTYDIDGNKVIHHLELSLIPDWEGADLERTFALEGGQLTLVADEVDTVVWERIG